MTIAVSATEIHTFQRCERLHHYLYPLGYRPAERAHGLRFAALLHEGLYAWWAAPADDRLTPALERLGFASNEPQTRVDDLDWIRADELLRFYHTTWNAEPLTVVATRLDFQTALVNPDTGEASSTVALCGRIPALAKDDQGRVWVVRHKTTAEADAPLFWDHLTFDILGAVHLAGARALGFEPAGTLYDVIGKPRLAPLKATPEHLRRYRQDNGALYAGQRDRDETPEAYRARYSNVLWRSERPICVRKAIPKGDERAALRDVWILAHRIYDARQRAAEGGWSLRNDGACLRWNHHLCAFFPVCSGADVIGAPAYHRTEAPMPHAMEEES